MLLQGVRAKYLKQLPPEFTDVKDSEVQGEASRCVPAGRSCYTSIPILLWDLQSVGRESGVQGEASRRVLLLGMEQPQADE